jgi:hypothetical protein
MTPEELANLMKEDKKTWFTLTDLSQKINTSVPEVQKILKKSNLFVRSSIRDEEGQDLYSSREDFQKKESFTNKILGAFKNRID